MTGDFEGFARANLAALLGFAVLLTGNLADAEDLVQVALGRALASWGRVSRADRPEAYVRRIMVNANSSRWSRARMRREVTVAEVPDAAAPEGLGVDDRLALTSALAALPTGQRAVLILRYVEDRTETDTAFVLGVSVGTVKSQTAKALANLRRSPQLAREDSHDIA